MTSSALDSKLLAKDNGAKHLLIPSPLDDRKSNVSYLSEFSKRKQPTYRSMAFVTFSMWMSFSALLLFQANLLEHIESNWKHQAMPSWQQSIFEHGVSATFIGTITFRIGHEIFWSMCSCKTRVVLSLCCMMLSLLLLSFIFFVLNARDTWWVVLANFIGGIGVGAIEPNLLSSILPLGDNTKVYAFYGISAGFNFMAVIGFYLLSIGVPLFAIYTLCAVLCALSIFIYLHIIKQTPSFVVTNESLDIIVNTSVYMHDKEDLKTSSVRLHELRRSLSEYKNWFFVLLPYGIFFTIDLFCMQFFCTVSLYVFYRGKIPMFPAAKGGNVWLDRNLYFAISGILNAFFQIVGNRTSYYTKIILKIGQDYPVCFVFVQIASGLMCSCVYFIQPIVTLVGIGGVYLMNGAIYSSGVKYIDTRIHPKYNLIALSVWFIFADIGSIIGQNTFEPLVEYVCNKHSTPSYYC